MVLFALECQRAHEQGSGSTQPRGGPTQARRAYRHTDGLSGPCGPGLIGLRYNCAHVCSPYADGGSERRLSMLLCAGRAGLADDLLSLATGRGYGLQGGL